MFIQVFERVGFICSGGGGRKGRDVGLRWERGRFDEGLQCEKEEEGEGLVVVLVMRPGFGLGDMGGRKGSHTHL